MDELSLIIQSLIDSEVDDMILDLVYEIHSSLKGIPQEQFQINKTISNEKQTCTCPNCGQSNLIATRFAYHLAKCLGKNINLHSYFVNKFNIYRGWSTIISSSSTSNYRSNYDNNSFR
jgi:hypothetical protein